MAAIVAGGVALAVALASGAAGALADARSESWAVVVSSMVKVRPGQSFAGARNIALSAARGECEAAQIVAKAPVTDLRAEAGRLTGKSGWLTPQLYREAFLNLSQPSNSEGSAGLWPDPLIPATDAYAQEGRNAFPASSRGPTPVVVYVEICVPASAAPGTYRGEIVLEAAGRQPLAVPVAMRVYSFALPATSSLPTSFGFASRTAALGHGLKPAETTVARMGRLYGEAALRHRISLHGFSFDPPPFTRLPDGMSLDFAAFDQEVGPFLDGTALPGGARFTSIDVRLHPEAKTDADIVDYWRATAAHLRKKGWLGRAFLYAKDEPRPEEIPEVRRFATLAQQADPALRVLVTASLDARLAKLAGIWAPNINCLFVRPGTEYCREIVSVHRYAATRKTGSSLWWYQSCGSHGCGPISPLDLGAQRYFRGWPSYMVDHDAALNRAMGALAFRYGIEGELYFNTVEAYAPGPDQQAPAGDPWRSVWRFAGNGDGTLFYPGTPAHIGGKSHVPVESLRLKHLREGLEDYEYLVLAHRSGLKKEAEAFAARVTAGPFEIERDGRLWAEARERLAGALEARLAKSRE